LRLLVLSLKCLRRVGVTSLFRRAIAVAEELRRDELVEHSPVGDRVVVHVGCLCHGRLLRRGGVPRSLVGGLEAAAALIDEGGRRRLGALHQLRELLQQGLLARLQKVMVLQLRLAVVELLAAVQQRRCCRVWVVVHQLPTSPQLLR
jgi:hypothetical protein